MDADEAGEMAGEFSEFGGEGVLDDLAFEAAGAAEAAFGAAGWLEDVDVVGDVVNSVFAR